MFVHAYFLECTFTCSPLHVSSQRQQADLAATAAVEEIRNKLSSLLGTNSEGGMYSKYYIRRLHVYTYVPMCVGDLVDCTICLHIVTSMS